MNAVLMQTGALTPTQQAVRDQFQEGGSIGTVLLLVAGLAMMVALAYWLSKQVQHIDSGPARVDDPQRLFEDWLVRLEMPAEQLQFLRAIARDLDLENPATILLSPVRFDRCLDQWPAHRQTSGQVRPRPPTALITQTRSALFPQAS